MRTRIAVVLNAGLIAAVLLISAGCDRAPLGPPPPTTPSASVPPIDLLGTFFGLQERFGAIYAPTPDILRDYLTYRSSVNQVASVLLLVDTETGIELEDDLATAEIRPAEAASKSRADVRQSFATAGEVRVMIHQLRQDAPPELIVVVDRAEAQLSTVAEPTHIEKVEFGGVGAGGVVVHKGDAIVLAKAVSGARGVYAKGGPGGFVDVSLPAGTKGTAHTDVWPTGDIWARFKHSDGHDVLVPLQRSVWTPAKTADAPPS